MCVWVGGGKQHGERKSISQSVEEASDGADVAPIRQRTAPLCMRTSSGYASDASQAVRRSPVGVGPERLGRTSAPALLVPSA